MVICDLCGASVRNLKNHKQTVHGIYEENDQKFMCDQCGIVFNKQDKLDFHLRLHLDEPKFCSQCNEGTHMFLSLTIKNPNLPGLFHFFNIFFYF